MVFNKEKSVCCVLRGSGVNTPQIRTYLRCLGYKLTPIVASGADVALVANEVTPGEIYGCPQNIAENIGSANIDCRDNVYWFMVLIAQADVEEINKHFRGGSYSSNVWN